MHRRSSRNGLALSNVPSLIFNSDGEIAALECANPQADQVSDDCAKPIRTSPRLVTVLDLEESDRFYREIDDVGYGSIESPELQRIDRLDGCPIGDGSGHPDKSVRIRFHGRESRFRRPFSEFPSLQGIIRDFFRRCDAPRSGSAL